MKYDTDHEFVSISSQNAKFRIILIHGWGADAEDLLPIGREIIENFNLDFEVISFRAPGLHPNNTGRQWYGLYPPNWDEADYEVNKLIQSIKTFDTSKIPLKKTILLGFSQGAAMAINVGSKLDLALIVSCSGYPHPNWNPSKKYPPIIISHGLKDDIVPSIASKNIYEKIQRISENFCELREFDGSHQIDPKLIQIVKDKIKKLF